MGDDFLAEEDDGYLDAVGAPDPPTSVPSDTGDSRAKVQVSVHLAHFGAAPKVLQLSPQDGVKLDEFGLPELQ